ncbi:VCBS repeat-containing protein [Roseimicrobium sp. ORNL1]|uniref:FG-GAP repeat domain-containing protein n=1 Tax=Roseimicrobium sp. ORNL1 TaxID=2711231 RepID=UPI0013E11B15|nr:VCBS repeat-containing protein [Roseimicrobium sp. ORNL1]QIF04371.1 VCBS repeat-containing protein [Roseimicrobium sp. ORNL1]
MIDFSFSGAPAGRLVSCRRAILLTIGGLIVASSPASEPALPTVRFTGPEVVKLDWNTRCPRVADFDGDGLQDLAVLNLDRSRVEFLLQTKEGVKEAAAAPSSRRDIWNPVLEVSRFRKEALVTGESMYALVVGDWNGDGRADVAYTTDGKRLVLRTQGKDVADWTQKKEFILDSVAYDADSLLAVDLNGDKRTDLALLTKTRLVVCLQGEKGTWQEPRNYALTQEGCAGLRAADVNGDGRADLFCTSEEADALLVRLQSRDGGFGEEWRLEIPAGESWVSPVHLGKEIALGWLQAGTGLVEIARLAAATVADADRAASVRHAIPPSDSKAGAAVFGDITGDGLDDAILAEPKRARVWLFAGMADGGFDEGKEYPSLSGVESMSLADVDGDGKTELVILSPAEKNIAIARWDAEKGRLSYPDTVYESEDALSAMTTGRLADGKENVVLCARESKPKNTLVSLSWNAKDKKLTPSTLEIPGLLAKPGALRILDADQDGRGDVAVFATLANTQIHLSRADAKAPFKKVEGLPDNLTSRLQPVALSQADIDGDGKLELIAAKEQLARAIKIDASGRAKVVEQFNAPDSSAQLSCAVMLPVKSGGGKRVLLFDNASRQLHELASDADGVYRVKRSRKIHASTLEDVRVLGKDGELRLLLLGKQTFDVLPLEGRTLKLESIASFTTELKDTKPADLVAAKFTGGEADDLMLLDTQQSRVAEFFRSKDAERHDWQSFLFFRIFQADPHYRGKTGFDAEPHDYIATDLNGDGRADLCLLVHDRLLLYVQE